MAVAGLIKLVSDELPSFSVSTGRSIFDVLVAAGVVGGLRVSENLASRSDGGEAKRGLAAINAPSTQTIKKMRMVWTGFVFVPMRAFSGKCKKEKKEGKKEGEGPGQEEEPVGE